MASNLCERGWESENYYADSATGQVYIDGYGVGILFDADYNVVVQSIYVTYT